MQLFTMSSLLHSSKQEIILDAIKSALERSDEAMIWKLKCPLYVEAILSVLIPLRDQHLLFDPEGNPHDSLDKELFLRWCDLLSLKTLAFTLSKSNQEKRLSRTKYPSNTSYVPIDLEKLGSYLSQCSISLENESLDFPISNYNLHVGITSLISNILEGTYK